MTDSLFEVPTRQNAPRCRLCIRPARWLPSRDQWGMYCNGYNCNNRDRLCRSCGNPFTMNIEGAGTKYCSPDCKAIGYRIADTVRPGRALTCAWCNQPNPATNRRYEGNWPYICQQCVDPIRHVVPRLKAHHVPHQRARALIQDPRCEVCGTNLLVKLRPPGYGKLVTPLVVDHDHACCPVDKASCGRCVRGLICRDCNVAAGLLKDSSKIAGALAGYLDRWFSR